MRSALGLPGGPTQKCGWLAHNAIGLADNWSYIGYFEHVKLKINDDNLL